MLEIVLIVLAATVIVLIVVVAMQPAEFRVTRSAAISAPAPAVFAQVNDLHKWDAWSPWAKLDPAARGCPPIGARTSTRASSSYAVCAIS